MRDLKDLDDTLCDISRKARIVLSKERIKTLEEFLEYLKQISENVLTNNGLSSPKNAADLFQWHENNQAIKAAKKAKKSAEIIRGLVQEIFSDLHTLEESSKQMKKVKKKTPKTKTAIQKRPL